ncbi:MAG TPA: HAD-IA family hydrolase [Acidobacteriaceae bacterium]
MMVSSSPSPAALAFLAPVEVRCQGVLFDMDGILVSSLGSVERCWSIWARMRGVDVDETVRTAHGRRAVETIALLRPDLDPAAELKVIEDLEITDNEGLAVLPGIPELLTALPLDRWTVVTSATDRLARVRLAAGGLAVPDRMIAADHVPQGKPHPMPYLRGAELLGLPPESCVVFEDSGAGAKAGRAAGCTVIATTFSHSIEDLAAAHYLVPDLSGIDVEVLPGNAGLALRFRPLAVESRG